MFVRSLRGSGGNTARAASLHALEGAALTLLEGYRLREPLLRREYLPTYGLRWGDVQLGQSTAADFRAAYSALLQKGAADEANGGGVQIGKHLMHVSACYGVCGSRAALSVENDYYNDLLKGPAHAESFLITNYADADCTVNETLSRMQCLFPPKQLIQDDCGKLIAMVRQTCCCCCCCCCWCCCRSTLMYV